MRKTWSSVERRYCGDYDQASTGASTEMSVRRPQTLLRGNELKKHFNIAFHNFVIFMVVSESKRETTARCAIHRGRDKI